MDISAGGSVTTKDIFESGVYVGSPIRKIKDTKVKLNGVPKWRV
jgi:acetyltransferase-like isoleucine patch superfamily enzyme